MGYLQTVSGYADSWQKARLTLLVYWKALNVLSYSNAAQQGNRTSEVSRAYRHAVGLKGVWMGVLDICEIFSDPNG